MQLFSILYLELLLSWALGRFSMMENLISVDTDKKFCHSILCLVETKLQELSD